MDVKDKSGIIIIISLLLITAALLLAHKYGMTKVFVIDAESEFTISTLDDRESGGASISSLTRQGSKLILECEIVNQYNWPFCELAFDLRTTQNNGELQGVDLSRFDKIVVWAQYESHEETGIRVHLRNFNSKYSTPNEYSSLKYNAIEFYNFRSQYPLVTSMKSFQVANWWQSEHQISLEDMAPEFSNVHIIEVVTQTDIPEGKYRLILEKIEFYGKWISTTALYRIILLLWVGTALSYVAKWVALFKTEFKKSKSRQHELEAINRHLDYKSQLLEKQVNRDSLTGLLNRKGLESVLMESLLAETNHLNFSIMFMDIDFFKIINDEHGHKIGDNVLKQFAALIEANIRKTDVIARWGGEEFVLVSSESNKDEIIQFAEKLRTAIENETWPKDASVTCSFGITTLTDSNFDTALERADKALYQAKRQGRNCVMYLD